MYLKSVAYNRDELLIKKYVILGVHINETCFKTGRVSTRDFTVIGSVGIIGSVSIIGSVRIIGTLEYTPLKLIQN